MNSPILQERIKFLKEFIGPKTVHLLALSIVIGVFWFAIEASFVYVLQVFLVAIGLIERSRTILPGEAQISIGLAVGCLIVFGAFRSIVLFSRTYISGVANQSFVRFQRQLILEQALGRGTLTSTHELAALFSETVTQAGIVLMKISELAVAGTSLGFFFLMGLYLAPRELLISTSVLIFAVGPMRIFSARIQSAGRGVQHEFGSVTKTLLLTLKNRLFLSIVGAVDTYVSSGSKSLQRYESHYKNFYRVFGLKSAVPNFLGISIIAIVTLLSLRFFHTPPIRLLGFFYVFIRLSQAAAEANGTITDFKMNLPAFRRLYQFRRSSDEATANLLSAQARHSLRDCHKVRFDDVCFSYPHRQPVLSGLNLELELGDRLWIQGPSGSGKSTLVLLLCGTYEPTSGTIWFDERDGRIINPAPLLAYTGPEPFLFDGTIRENLLLGMGGRRVDDTAIADACRHAELSDFIRSLPGGLDYILNEQAQLSTGQRQRLAIARAILRDARVMVFDEATSNIDHLTENQILLNLKDFFRSKIVVFITHRDSLRKHVNKALVLPQGRFEELE